MKIREDPPAVQIVYHNISFLSLYSVSCFYPSSTLLELSRSQKFFCSGFHCKISASVLYSDLFVRMCRTCTHYPLYLRRLYVWRWRGNFIISLVSLSLTLLNRFCFQCSNLSTQLCSNVFSALYLRIFILHFNR